MSLDKDFITQTLGKQLLRSGTSVGANTRSAFRGRSNKEFVAKLGIVIEEADECIFWLELLNEGTTLNKELTDKLIKEADQLVAIFVSIVKKNKL